MNASLKAPWSTERTAVYDVVRNSEGDAVAFVSLSDWSRKTMRLIADAPLMLQLLETIKQQRCFTCDCGVDDSVFSQLTSLLQKHSQAA